MPRCCRLGPDGGEELARQRGHAARPGVAGREVAVQGGGPAGRDHVVGADRQQHVAGGGDRGERGELAQRLRLRRRQVGRLVDAPPGPVVVGHVAGQQPVAVGGEPLELAGELHPRVVAHRAPRPPLVEGPAGPGRRGQPGRGHQARVAGVEPERVQHPGAVRVAAEHVALMADPVDRVADGGLGAGQVGVRLVVVAADDLDPALGHQRAQVRPVLGVGVEVGLEVVDLGQHELVVGVGPGRVQVQPDQLERGAHLRAARRPRRAAAAGTG